MLNSKAKAAIAFCPAGTPKQQPTCRCFVSLSEHCWLFERRLCTFCAACAICTPSSNAAQANRHPQAGTRHRHAKQLMQPSPPRLALFRCAGAQPRTRLAIVTDRSFSIMHRVAWAVLKIAGQHHVCQIASRTFCMATYFLLCWQPLVDLSCTANRPQLDPLLADGA